MTRRPLYLVLAILGALVPWLFFSSFFSRNGLDIPLFAQSLFANGAAGVFSADVLLSIVVFWLWSLGDAKKLGIKSWWLVLPAACFVGLSLALPLYLYFREGLKA